MEFEILYTLNSIFPSNNDDLLINKFLKFKQM